MGLILIGWVELKVNELVLIGWVEIKVNGLDLGSGLKVNGLCPNRLGWA